jgi:hypothetical protein
VPATRLLRAAPFAVATLLLAGAGSAFAGGERRASPRDRAASTISAADASLAVRSLLGRSTFSAASNAVPESKQHGGDDLHLPPTRRAIDLVSKLQMNTPTDRRSPATIGDPVLDGQIADLAIYKNFAYLNSWDDPTCRRGGTFIVDISNPAQPQQTGFLPALAGRYHGEGAHVITLDTPAFQGDLLAVNNEPYTGVDPSTGEPCTDDIFGNGGFDLYNVTDPRRARAVVQGAGDFEDEGTVFETANSSHSVFMWQGRDRRAFLVAVDNIEGTDVDIFEITNPATPRLVGEFDLDEYLAAPANEPPSGVDIVDEGGLGGENDVFLHDLVVKQMGDRFVMLADYWDAGYVTLDVTNPSRPRYIGDSTFDAPDPLTGQEPQEGNGHQAEFSHDNRYILAADEDFSPYRPEDFGITTGPNAGEFPAVSVAGGTSPGFLEDDTMNGPTVYGGYGCDASAPIPPRATAGLPPLEDDEEAIIVLQRGPSQDPNNPEDACFPGEKAENGIAAGYDAVLLTNHHAGESLGVFCGSGDFPPSPPIVTVCTTHEALHLIFGEPNNTTVPYPPGHGPPLGDLGEKVSATASFDGWGYARLIENTPGKMREVDAHAVKEAMNPELAFGFGDLSIHEFATDPTENVAYSAYYAAGMRVFTFGPGGLTEQGKFIDQGGNNFWGVEQFTSGNERYFAGSDRDFGLYIFRYTGPGAAQRPVCINSMAMVPFKGAADVVLPCSDANANPLTRAVTSTPAAGTLSGDANSGAVRYTHRDGTVGATDSFTFTANDGVATSNTATATIVTVARDGGRCFNRYVGTAAKENLMGSGFGDSLHGAAGDDTIDGLGGADCLFGNAGRDQLLGNLGNDRERGGAGKDRIFGGSGRDRLFGGAGPDHLRGSSGNDRVRGGKGNDKVDGGSNNDRVYGGAGTDRLRGGPGRDRVYGGAGRDRLDAGDARLNRLSGGGGNDRLLAVNGKRDVVRCGKGRDFVRADRQDRVAGDCEVVRRAITTRD